MVMPQLNVNIPEELNKKVRMKAGIMYGAQKDSITRAVNQALKDWVNKKEDERYIP